MDDQDAFVVRHRALTKFAQVEFAILRYTESEQLRPTDIATLVGLFYFVDWGRRTGNEDHAPKSERLTRMLGVERKGLWRSIGRLEACGIIRRRVVVGKPTLFDILAVEDWLEPTRSQKGAGPKKGPDPAPKRDCYT